jgi:hypothetical protein
LQSNFISSQFFNKFVTLVVHNSTTGLLFGDTTHFIRTIYSRIWPWI